MNNKFANKLTFNSAQTILQTLGFVTISCFSIPASVEAATFDCGPGNNWVETCSGGLYEFESAVQINVNFISPDNQIDFTSNLTGRTGILTGDPVDAISGDPLVGDVGNFDGNLDVIPTEFFSTITGSTPFEPVITAFMGDGTPDLAPTPFDDTIPFESLYSGGAIIQQADNPALADSFFDLFIQVEGVIEGTLRNLEPIRIAATSPLTGLPPQSTSNVLQYVSGEIIPLYEAGPDRIYGTEDDWLVSSLVPDENGNSIVFALKSVPEPATVFSSLFAGVATLLFCKRKEQSNSQS